MKKLSVFISYSHLDKDEINEFKKHISPLQTNGLIDIWDDQKIIPGQKLQDKITDNLKNSDIVCLLISANFLSSPACQKEKEVALELNKIKGVAVIPIILSKCSWLDDGSLSLLLALPADAKAIEEHDNQNSAWNYVYKGLKAVIEEEIKVKELKFQKDFADFLQSVEMLTKAHSRKETVNLDDIFIHPELDKYDEIREYEMCESSEQLINDLYKYQKILIAGENQSGKTTLCKKIILKLRENNFVPVYLFDESKQYQGKMVNRIKSAFEKQYQGVEIEEINQKRIVPIIDDFHCAKQKEKHINMLSEYKHQVIIVDDIFSLNLKQEVLIRKFKHFKIKELSPSLRNKLIEKWTNLTDKVGGEFHNNALYQNIDSTTELINTSLGKIMGSGIMPAYPFFILSVLTTNETVGASLDHEITSQGHCYQALIYLYLTKEGVKNEEIDTYINFLTELSFFFYKKDSNILTVEDFKVFMKRYLKKYNLPVKENTLLLKLEKTRIITLDSCNHYSFCYPYLYYFFVAKYISEHIDDNKKIVDLVIKNLHKDENAYITIFISHHSKSPYVLNKIVQNASNLFKSHASVSASLNKEEVSFFDDKLDIIIKEALPATSSTPEKERTKRLKIQDNLEERKRLNEENDVQKADDSDDLIIELRRSIKTVEVMGRIIKNRAGSLEKENLEDIFRMAMNVHFRILTYFFNAIKNEEEEVINFISDRINKIIEEKDSQRVSEGKKPVKLKDDELERLSRTIFWNMNFFFVYSLINKIVHSIGSDKLTEIVKTVCDKENTPASFLVKHGILMWYNKNLQVDNIVSKINNNDFSETAKKIMKFMVVNHCSMHSVDFKQKDKIGKRLEISSQKLIKQRVYNKKIQ